MKVTLDIPDELYARLEEAAKAKGWTVQELLLDVAECIIEEKKPR